jgi:WD40 repeat protein
VVFSPDGAWVASSWGKVWLWNVRTNRKAAEFNQAQALWIAFSPDNKTLVSTHQGSIHFWDMASKKENATIHPHDGWINCVAMAPDGKQMISLAVNALLQLWDLATGRELLQTEINGRAESIAYSPDGKKLAVGRGTMIDLFDSKTLQPKHVFKRHDRAIMSVVFSPDGQVVASGSDDATIKLWSIKSGEEIKHILGHRFGVRCLAFSPDGRMLASGGADAMNRTRTSAVGSARIWSTKTGKELVCLSTARGGVNSLGFSPDGKLLAVANDRQSVEIWKLG